MSLFDDREANQLLASLPDRLVAVLGARLVGLYLYGSLITGDYDAGISDIDLLAVIESPLTVDEFARLDVMHQAIVREQPVWDDRLELLYLPRVALHTFRHESSPLGVISPGEQFNVKPAGIEWIMNWYFVRNMGQTLYGPPPATLMEPIGHDEFLQATYDHAISWQGWVETTRNKSGYQAYAVLTLSRAAYTLHHGAHVSKRRAADWAAAQWPEWGDLIRHAWTQRATPTPLAEPETTYAATAAYVRFVVTHLRRTAAQKDAVRTATNC